ncbi:MAG TPA: hypothetical protein VK587_00840 [bacterium]|nr:hypothetical protein [bacterium]
MITICPPVPDAGIDEHPRIADGAGVEQRARQPDQRVASVVFRYRQHASRAGGGVDHLIAAGDGEREGLFDQDVLAGVERPTDEHMVEVRLGRDVDGRHLRRFLKQCIEGRVHARTRAQLGCRGLGQQVRVAFVGVAQRRDPEGRDAAQRSRGRRVLLDAVEVPRAHAPAADDRQIDLLHPVPPRRGTAT